MGLFKNGVGRPSNETIKKRRIFYVALVAILGLTVAFAALSTTLTINGQAKVNKSSWNVHFDNLELKEENGHGLGNEVGTNTDNAKIEESGIEINNLNAELSEPNDSVVYTVDIVNEGEIDAVVHINEYFENTLPDQLEVTALYSDNTSIITEEKELDAGESLPVTITIKYKNITEASDLVLEDTIVNIQYILVAEQKSTFNADSGSEGEIIDIGGDTYSNYSFKVLSQVDFSSLDGNGEEIVYLKLKNGNYACIQFDNNMDGLDYNIITSDLQPVSNYTYTVSDGWNNGSTPTIGEAKIITYEEALAAIGIAIDDPMSQSDINKILIVKKEVEDGGVYDNITLSYSNNTLTVSGYGTYNLDKMDIICFISGHKNELINYEENYSDIFKDTFWSVLDDYSLEEIFSEYENSYDSGSSGSSSGESIELTEEERNVITDIYNILSPIKDFSIENLIIDEGITSIGYDAFAGCNIKNVTLPTSLEEIKEGAFSDNQIQNLVIPSGVRRIEYSFDYNDLRSVRINSTNIIIVPEAFASNPNLTLDNIYIADPNFNKNNLNLH